MILFRVMYLYAINLLSVTLAQPDWTGSELSFKERRPSPAGKAAKKSERALLPVGHCAWSEFKPVPEVTCREVEWRAAYFEVVRGPQSVDGRAGS